MSDFAAIDLHCNVCYIDSLESGIHFVMNTPGQLPFYGFINDTYEDDYCPTFKNLVNFAEFVRNGNSGNVVFYTEEIDGYRTEFAIIDNEDGGVTFEAHFQNSAPFGLGRKNCLHYDNTNTTRKLVLAWLHEFANCFVNTEGFDWRYVLKVYGNNERNDSKGIEAALAWMEPRIDALYKKYEAILDRPMDMDRDDPEFWQAILDAKEYDIEVASLAAYAQNKFFTKTPKQEAYLKLYKKMMQTLEMQDFEM